MPAKCKRTVMIAYLLERMYCLYIRILASVMVSIRIFHSLEYVATIVNTIYVY